MNFTEYKEMDDEFKSIFDSSKFIKSEHNEGRIQCVSVNSKQEIAVSIGTYVNVYDFEGNYIYGYYISTTKPNVISLHNQNIEVYIDIYKCYFVINQESTVSPMYRIESSKNNSIISNELYDFAHSSEWRVGDITLVSTGDKLLKKDRIGNEVTIYSMSEAAKKVEKNDYVYAMIFSIAIALLFALTIVIKVVRQ